MICVFAGARSSISLGVDSASKIRLKPEFARLMTALTTAPAQRLSPATVGAHRTPIAATTLLELRCALNL